MNLHKGLDGKNPRNQTQERKVSLRRWARDCEWKREPLKKITYLMQGTVLTGYRDVGNKLFIPTFQKILAGYMMHRQFHHGSDALMCKITIQHQDQVFGVAYISKKNIYKMLNILFHRPMTQESNAANHLRYHDDHQENVSLGGQDRALKHAVYSDVDHNRSLSYCQKFMIKKILSTWLRQIVTDSYVDRKKAQTFQFVPWEYTWEIVDKNSMEQKHVFYVHYAHDVYQDLYIQLPFDSVVKMEKTPMGCPVSWAEKIHRTHQLMLQTQMIYPLDRLRCVDHMLKLKVGDKIPLFSFSGDVTDLCPQTQLRWIYHKDELATGLWGQNGETITFQLQNFSKKYI